MEETFIKSRRFLIFQMAKGKKKKRKFLFKRRDFTCTSSYKKLMKKIFSIMNKNVSNKRNKELESYLYSVRYKFESIALFLAKLNNLYNDLANEKRVFNFDFKIELYSTIDFLFFEIASCWDIIAEINNLIFKLKHPTRYCKFKAIINDAKKNENRFIKSELYFYLTYSLRNPNTNFDIFKFIEEFIRDRTFTTHYNLIKTKTIPVKSKKGKNYYIDYFPYSFPDNPHEIKRYPLEKDVRNLFNTAWGITTFLFDLTLKDVYKFKRKKIINNS